MNKQDIRSELVAKRKSLTTNEIKQNSQRVLDRIIHSDVWFNARHVGIYLPFNGEIDLSMLLDESTKDIYIPAIMGQSMQFHRHHANLIIRPHRYGILQPNFIPELEPAALDLCLTPLVGFDMNGNRLGMGGGYYDRYFAGNQQTILAGVAHQFQQVSQLPADPWDVKLQHIFTDQGHITP